MIKVRGVLVQRACEADRQHVARETYRFDILAFRGRLLRNRPRHLDNH